MVKVVNIVAYLRYFNNQSYGSEKRVLLKFTLTDVGIRDSRSLRIIQKYKYEVNYQFLAILNVSNTTITQYN